MGLISSEKGTFCKPRELREKKFKYRSPTRSKYAGLYVWIKAARGLSSFRAKSSQQVYLVQANEMNLLVKFTLQTPSSEMNW